MRAAEAIDALTEGTELRTWSLIVTIFGDMARAPGAELPGPVLSALTARIGVRPEAVRVALHRLRKDGWLASRRDGRLSHYLLTEAGRGASERATARIYAAGPTDPGPWHVVVAGPMDAAARLACESDLSATGYIALAPGAWLGPGPRPARPDPGLFYLEGRAPALPDWLRASLMPETLARAYADFDASLGTVEAALAGPGPLAPLDRAAIRALLVHGWRRLVLRHPDLPDEFFPAHWSGPRTRARVQALLKGLGQPTANEIADEIDASV
ncbi:MAG: PaaX family transcriptional regulator [Maritimibacter sp.]|nr:PaaX family transcriptional regulator [Maritimibacter sp.]